MLRVTHSKVEEVGVLVTVNACDPAGVGLECCKRLMRTSTWRVVGHLDCHIASRSARPCSSSVKTPCACAGCVLVSQSQHGGGGLAKGEPLHNEVS